MLAEQQQITAHGRYGQRHEPASGSGQAATLPHRRHGGSLPGRERADAIGERQYGLRAADRFDSRSSERFAGSRPKLNLDNTITRGRWQRQRSKGLLQAYCGIRLDQLISLSRARSFGIASTIVLLISACRRNGLCPRLSTSLAASGNIWRCSFNYLFRCRKCAALRSRTVFSR